MSRSEPGSPLRLTARRDRARARVWLRASDQHP